MFAAFRRVWIAIYTGGVARFDQQKNEPNRIVPHARTLRKAREQVKVMVATGFSTRRIRSYLHLWAVWWVRTSETWQYNELLDWFIRSCWNIVPAAFAAGLQYKSTLSRTPVLLESLAVA